jgi:hypothetical protein
MWFGARHKKDELKELAALQVEMIGTNSLALVGHYPVAGPVALRLASRAKIAEN